MIIFCCVHVITSKSWNLFFYNLDLSTTETLLVHIVRDRHIRESREEKAAELEERVEDVLRQGQKDLQETRTKHKKELAKVGYALCNKTITASTTTKNRLLYSTMANRHITRNTAGSLRNSRSEHLGSVSGKYEIGV